jgi:hypothetical protein
MRVMDVRRQREEPLSALRFAGTGRRTWDSGSGFVGRTSPLLAFVSRAQTLPLTGEGAAVSLGQQNHSMRCLLQYRRLERCCKATLAVSASEYVQSRYRSRRRDGSRRAHRGQGGGLHARQDRALAVFGGRSATNNQAQLNFAELRQSLWLKPRECCTERAFEELVGVEPGAVTTSPASDGPCGCHPP